jgi:hypothetical protein
LTGAALLRARRDQVNYAGSGGPDVTVTFLPPQARQPSFDELGEKAAEGIPLRIGQTLE